MRLRGKLLKELGGNYNFMLLWGGFALGTGTVWAVLIVEQQLITPCGYSDFFSGMRHAHALSASPVPQA